MPLMYPPGVNRETCSNLSAAEFAVYRALEEALPGPWWVLHSLWLKHHARKAHAEVDFLIIGERSILLLEVKGGLVSRDDQGWHFVAKGGRQETIRPEGPFDQVRGAYYGIKKHLATIGREALFHDYVWGYGVITPECIPKIKGSDPSVDAELLLDMKGFPEGLWTFLERLEEYWSERSLQQKEKLGLPSNSLKRSIPEPVRKEILSCLRPDFECVRGLGVHVRQAEADILRLTIDQYQALDYARKNPRIVINGAAGTGKTMLALEQARRQARNGKRVLFTCFNRLLAKHLAEVVQSEGLPRLEVANYHQLIIGILQEAGMHTALPDDWGQFNKELDTVVWNALDRLGAFGRYDYLVLDEAQDLMSTPFTATLDFLLKGERKQGAWTMCFDPDQAIFEDNFEREIYQSYAALGYEVSLDINCRNTRQVASHVKGLSERGSSRILGAEGPDVLVDYYRDLTGYHRCLKRTVNAFINDFAKAGVPASEIMILAADNAFLNEEVMRPGFFLRPVVDAKAWSGQDTIRCSTVQAFKGLEAASVVLVGLEDLDSVRGRRLLYVGGSRARSALAVLVPDRCSGYVQSCNSRILQALEGQGTVDR